jgi:hypothetical protein
MPPSPIGPHNTALLLRRPQIDSRRTLEGAERTLREYTRVTDDVLSGTYKRRASDMAETGSVEYRRINENKMDPPFIPPEYRGELT